MNTLSAFFPLLAMACGSIGAIVRKASPSAGFWHTPIGHLALVALGALLGALGPMFQGGIVTRETLISALIGGGVAFLSALKPTGTGAAASLLILALGLSLSACTPAFKACQLGALPQTAQTLAADVLGILYNPASVVADLEALPNQPEVQCIVQAWQAYEASKAPAPVGVAAATSADMMGHAHGLAAGYLAKHPAKACAERVTS